MMYDVGRCSSTKWGGWTSNGESRLKAGHVRMPVSVGACAGLRGRSKSRQTLGVGRGRRWALGRRRRRPRVEEGRANGSC